MNGSNRRTTRLAGDSVLAALLGLGIALVAPSLSPVARAQEKDPRTVVMRSPKLYYIDRYDVSPNLRDMPIVAPEGEPEEAPEARLIHPPQPVSRTADPLVRRSTTASPLLATTPGLSFDGVGVGLSSFLPYYAPPDTNGAAGDGQYVQWVNVSFAVFDKYTGKLQFGPAAGKTLWKGFGGACEHSNDGDPIATYDKQANRWVLSQFSLSGGGFWQCVAVSTTSDATGSYRRFAYPFAALNDYPKFGTWPDGYYVTFNMFGSFAFQGARVCAMDRNAMLSASDVPGPIQCFQLSPAFGGLLPSDLDGATAPPAGAPNFMLALGFDSLRLWKMHTDWTTPANTTLTGPLTIPVAPFFTACGGGNCIPQLGTSNTLASLGDRLMYRLAYRNFGDHESLVANHSVAAEPAPSGIRWYEVRDPNGTPTLFQQGTISPDATSRWMGSIAMDSAGNMAVGYSASSALVRPGIRVTGRLASDPDGTMQAEQTLVNGGGSQGNNLKRWGDYSAMTIDPSDDCRFWFTTEYLKANGSFNWSTRIASFRFPSCVPAPTSIELSAPAFTASERTGKATIKVKRSSGYDQATVDYATSGGTAVAGTDFTSTSGTLSFDVGVVTQTISVLIANDTLDDDGETFSIALANPTGPAVVLGANSVASVTITDDDVAGQVQFGAAAYTVSEGAPALTVSVVRTGGAAAGASVEYTTSDGTATAPDDYTQASGSFTFAAGQMSKTFSVPINPDTIHEGTETLLLALSNPGGGATLGARHDAVVSITDDDRAGSLQFGAAAYSVSEGAGTATVTVVRTGGLASGVLVDYTTSDGSATEGSDYAASSGTLSFGAGVTSASFAITILDDASAENNETIKLSLGNPRGGATLGARSSALLTVLENETVLQFSAANFATTEASGAATITVKRSGLTTGTAVVAYATSDGSALGGADYTARSGNLTFTPGVLSKTFTIPVANDAAGEGPETVVLRLTPVSGGDVGPTGTAVLTIGDNDQAIFSFAAPAYAVIEGVPMATLAVKRAGNVAKAASVNYATQDGSATSGADYTGSTATLNFAAGVVSRTISIPIANDGVAEADETVNVLLSAPSESDALASPAAVILTIKDGSPRFSFGAPTYFVKELFGKAQITVKRSGGLTSGATVDYSTSDGTALAGSDYTGATNEALSFGPGVATKTIVVTIAKDGTPEGTESFGIALSNPSAGYGLGVPSAATVAVTDATNLVDLSAARYSVTESAGSATITLKRVGDLTFGPVEVGYSVSDGTATAPADFTAATGVVFFGAGEATKTLSIPIVNDTLAEGSETVNVQLLFATSPFPGVGLGPQQTATVTIVDNELAGSIGLSATAYALTEDAGAATITFTRTGGAASAVSVDWTTADENAVSPDDYAGGSGTVTFGAGETTKTLTIPITDDALTEFTESFTITLGTPGGGATLGANSRATVYIVDND